MQVCAQSVEKERKLDNERFLACCSKEFAATAVRHDYSDGERIWRDELMSHHGDLNYDLYYAAAETRLAKLLHWQSICCQLPMSSETEMLYKDAMRIIKNVRGNADGSEVQLELASLYFSQGRQQESEIEYKKNLMALKEKYGEDNWYVRQTTYALAHLFESQKRYSEGEALLKDAIRACRAHRAGDFSTPYTLNELAMLYLYQGRDGDALSLFEDALKANGGDFNDVALNAGRVLHRLGRDAEAEAKFKVVLENRRQCKIFDNEKWQYIPDTAAYNGPVMIALGELYADNKRYAESEPLLKKALKLNEVSFNAQSFVLEQRARQHDIKVASQAMAKMYRSQGRDADAKAVLKEVSQLVKPDREGAAEVKWIGALSTGDLSDHR
jgi:tetratricopeptide (TPR) repeat protein